VNILSKVEGGVICSAEDREWDECEFLRREEIWSSYCGKHD
jgi:hypothetical protein